MIHGIIWFECVDYVSIKIKTLGFMFIQKVETNLMHAISNL